jgi:hypothetical protein
MEKCIKKLRNSHTILNGNPGGKRPLQTPGYLWVDNIKMDTVDTVCEGVDYIQTSRDKVQN